MRNITSGITRYDLHLYVIFNHRFSIQYRSVMQLHTVRYTGTLCSLQDNKVTETVIYSQAMILFSYLGQHYTSCFQSLHQHNAALSESALPAVNTNEEVHLWASSGHF